MTHAPTDARLHGLDRFVRHSLRMWHVPGVAVGVIERGRVIHAKGYGVCDCRREARVDENTRFAVASCTKAFTATALGILVDEGVLDWDTPVRTYWPSFKMHDRVATERMTPRDLLTHRSGLPRHDSAWMNSPFSRAELCRRLQHLRPSKGFRELYQYNNLMYMAAGFLIEQVTGETWEQFVQERLLGPLGMGATRIVTDGSFGTYALATPHAKKDGRVFPALRGWLRRAGLVSLFGPVGPAGALASTVPDMCRWLEVQMNGGRLGTRRIISAKNLREIHTPQVMVPEPPAHPELLDAAYAMGWLVQPYRGRRWISHTGSFTGFNSRASFLPREKIGVVVLTNIDASPLVTTIPLYVFDRLLGLEPVRWNARMKRVQQKEAAEANAAKHGRRRTRRTPPERPLKELAGEYVHPGYGRVLVTQSGGALTLEYNGMRATLLHERGDVFRTSGPAQVPRWESTFRANKAGRVVSVAIHIEPSVAPVVFRKRNRR